MGTIRFRVIYRSDTERGRQATSMRLIGNGLWTPNFRLRSLGIIVDQLATRLADRIPTRAALLEDPFS
jgi:hypothetical protein